MLFTARMHPWEASFVKHDEDLFPLERIWADQLPHHFELIFGDGTTRIYRFKP